MPMAFWLAIRRSRSASPVVLYDPVSALAEPGGRLIRRVARPECEPQEPRRARPLRCVTGQETDRLSVKVGRQVVPTFECSWRIDARIVEHELRSILIGFRVHKSVEAIKAAPERPAVERTGCASFGQGSDVPLAHDVIAAGMGSQHLVDSHHF